MVAPGQKTNEIFRISADEPIPALQGIVQMWLVEQREPACKINALGSTTKVMNGFDDGWTYSGTRADRAPRLEMVGMEVDNIGNLGPGQPLGQLLDEGRVPAHRFLPFVHRTAGT